jgi:hypothetical protein
MNLKLDYSGLPDHLRDGMRRYFEARIRPGRFLNAVLEGDLVGTVLFADENSLGQLPTVIRWLRDTPPISTWCSRERVNAWVDHRNLVLSPGVEA